jgi:hypothetical protein
VSVMLAGWLEYTIELPAVPDPTGTSRRVIQVLINVQ